MSVHADYFSSYSNGLSYVHLTMPHFQNEPLPHSARHLDRGYVLPTEPPQRSKINLHTLHVFNCPSCERLKYIVLVFDTKVTHHLPLKAKVPSL